ncbi:UNVERIFIED_CONTAM: hypothetical protein ABID98_001602 [Brevibacillus sp. OAP136]
MDVRSTVTKRKSHEQYRKQGSPVVALDPLLSVPGIIRQLIDVHRHVTLCTELVSSKLLTDLITELLLGRTFHDEKNGLRAFATSSRYERNGSLFLMSKNGVLLPKNSRMQL